MERLRQLLLNLSVLAHLIRHGNTQDLDDWLLGLSTNQLWELTAIIVLTAIVGLLLVILLFRGVSA